MGGGVTIRSKKLTEYFKKHSSGFRVQVGIFSNYKNKRKKTGTTLTSDAYGIKRVKSRKASKATNVGVLLANIKGRKTDKYTVPVRNPFELLKRKKYWEATRFSFVKEFYKVQPATDVIDRRLGNLGVTTMKRAIRDYNIIPNSPFTEAEKGFNKALTDSGQMRDAFTYRKYTGGAN